MVPPAAATTGTDRASTAKRSQPTSEPRRLAAWLLLSFGFLVAERLLTRGPDYPDGPPGVGWLLVGALLLWLVWRTGSWLAWAACGVLAWFGAVVFGLVVLTGPSEGWQVALAACYLGQALPLLSRTVRRHVFSC